MSCRTLTDNLIDDMIQNERETERTIAHNREVMAKLNTPTLMATKVRLLWPSPLLTRKAAERNSSWNICFGICYSFLNVCLSTLFLLN